MGTSSTNHPDTSHRPYAARTGWGFANRVAEFIMMFLLFQVLGDHGGASAMQAGTEEMVCEAGGHAAAMCCLLHFSVTIQ